MISPTSKTAAALNTLFPDDGRPERGDDVDADGGAQVGLHEDLGHVGRQHRARPRHARARAQPHGPQDRRVHLQTSNIEFSLIFGRLVLMPVSEVPLSKLIPDLRATLAYLWRVDVGRLEDARGGAADEEESGGDERAVARAPEQHAQPGAHQHELERHRAAAAQPLDL